MRFAYDIFDNSDRQDYAQFGNAAQDIDTGIKLNNIKNKFDTIDRGIDAFGRYKLKEGEIAAQVDSAKSQARQQTDNTFMNSIFGIGSSVLRNLPKPGGGLGNPGSFSGVNTGFGEGFPKFNPGNFEIGMNLGSWY